jgi:hypothetical protein
MPPTATDLNMTDRDATQSPLKRAAGSDTTRAVEAFSLLGHETRLAILLALWDAYVPGPSDDAVSFSELLDRVGIRDSGQFNYHLGKLEGHFVRKTEDGYVLRRAGQKLVRAVIAGAGIEEPSLEPTEIDIECPYCGAQTAILYDDGWLYRVCTECEGAYEGDDHQPDGYLTGAALDPAGISNRSLGEMWAAAVTLGHQNMKSMLEGVCPECSGTVDGTLVVCEAHDDEGVCDNCGRTTAELALLNCQVCKALHAASPSTLVAHHPAVVAFYYERGVAIQYETDGFESAKRRVTLTSDHEQELVSTDPHRVLVRVRYAGDVLELTIDEELNVVEERRPD